MLLQLLQLVKMTKGLFMTLALIVMLLILSNLRYKFPKHFRFYTTITAYK